MIRRLLLLILIVGLAPIAPAQTAGPGPLTSKEVAQGFRDGYVLAKPRASHLATADVAEGSEGFRMARKFSRFGGIRLLKIRAGETPAEAVSRLLATGRYEFVEPDFTRTAASTPNDPDFFQQWALNNTGTNGPGEGIPGADIHAETAWSSINSTNNPAINSGLGVIVAVLDTGIDLTQTDLVANLWQNPNPQEITDGYTGGQVGLNLSHNGAGPDNPNDDNGHGTHVAGIVGAVGNNGIGVTGVAWTTQLMALKFLNYQGDSNPSSGVSDEITCIDFAIAHGANVINASFGSSTYSGSEYTAIQRAGMSGIIFVAAAGNNFEDNNLSPFYPAAYLLDNIVAVAASDNRDDAANFTNYGSGLVDLAAPGENVLSLYNSSSTGTATISGTSMATPFVTGAIALLKAEWPSDTYRQLINRLLNGVDQNANWTGKTQTGGRLNLANAVSSTDQNTPFNDTFARRAHLSGTALTVRSNNVGASLDGGEPIIAGVAGGHSLWWEWTAPATGAVTVTGAVTANATTNTQPSAYPTLLGVYTGTSVSGLSAITTDATPGPGAANVTFVAHAGTVYEITVDGQAGASGLTSFTLAYGFDAFSSPVTLAGASAGFTGTSQNATREFNEPYIANYPGGHSVWFNWTAPKTGQFQVSAFSLDFDPLLAVYTGSSVSSLTGVASKVGGAINSSAAVPASTAACTFDATAGTVYAITVDGAIDGNGTALGAGQFTLSIADPLWSVSNPPRDAITCSPKVGADGTVYVGGDDGYFYATNANGSAKWKMNLETGMDTSAAALSSDGTRVYAAAGASVYALSTSDGSQIWKYTPNPSNPPPPVATPPIVGPDGTIYVKDTSDELYAINAGTATGTTLKWSTAIPGTVTNGLVGASYAAPAVGANGTVVYIGSDNSIFYAFNSANGALNWTFTADGAIYTAPAIDSAGNIYFGTINGTFYAVSPLGVKIWSYKNPNNGAISSSPAIGSNGIVYFGCYDHNLYALNTSNGLVVWTYALGGEVRASSPAIDSNGVIYVGCYDNNVYAIAPDGSLARTYATGYIVRSSPAIFGNAFYVGSEDHQLYAFSLATAAPSFALSPGSATVATGRSVVFSATAGGIPAPTYQWNLNGTAIPGATDRILLVSGATSANAGSYTCTATNSVGSVTSAGGTLTVTAAANPGRLINLSARADVGTGNNILIGGFGVGGAGTKQLLVRGVGPALSVFFNTELVTPQLVLLDNSGAVVATNIGWGNAPVAGASTASEAPTTATTNLMNSLGAYPIAAGSGDTAMALTMPQGNNTAQLSGVGGTSGIALCEIYDADTASPPSARLINISARADVGTGNNILIGGFAIGGATAETVLIRAVGPGLNDELPGVFPLSTVLNQPVLTLLTSGGTVITSNTVWGGDATIAGTFGTTGAFSLNPAHADSVLLLTLPPGNYTAEVTGLNSGTGIALCEIYEVH